MTYLRLLLLVLGMSFLPVEGQVSESLEIEIIDSKPGIHIAIPIPKNTIELTTQIKVRQLLEKSSQQRNDAKASFTMLWPALDGHSRSIRTLILTFAKPLRKGEKFAIDLVDSRDSRLTAWEEPAGNFVDVNFTSGWLQQALYTPMLAPGDSAPSWFDYAYRQLGYSLGDMDQINQDPKVKRNFTTSPPWLYDRVYVLYQLYFQTGDVYFKHMAHQSALTYRSLINEFGYFSLKKGNDIKYLLSPGLILDHQFYPDDKNIDLIEQFYQNSLRWPAQYQLGLNFWTERNLSVALANALAHWEMSQSKDSLKRIQVLLQGSMNTLKKSQKHGLNCLAHPYRVHEGKADNVLVCSPWMNALLAHQLFKFWQLTDSDEAATLIVALGKNVVEQGTYLAPKGKIKGRTVPKYLMFAQSSKFEDPMAHSDMQHACDVAGLVVSARYLAMLKQQDSDYFKGTMEDLLYSCRTNLGVDKKKNSWRIKPLRKFNWWFNSTGSMSWKLAELDKFERSNGGGDSVAK
ncbi:hypothetical protein [Thalassotalea sp. PS06]|uniref:hypothetical protein n=1 Tax=Thalassotalea sp. PS06 TaxID=2594005 RepID=UPI001164124D|nr:hypothetical protein [Thalassotalea sp. PS06]QDO99981.1 hypothetical protein FNC98_00665 [Thalassotalea sp. PS06]